MEQVSKFTRYQIAVALLIALIQFSVVLDFMVLAPLGTFVMDDLKLQPDKFGLVVAAYAISAFFSALLTAGFADKFDRKKLLMFFFGGFIVGTLLCGLATDYWSLLGARIFTGLFGGVMGSISMAIVTDVFEVSKRGRIMGFIQMGFGVSQIVGIPFGLWLTNKFNWHMPFYAIVAFAGIIFVLTLVFMKPIDAHLAIQEKRNAFQHLYKTLSNRRYQRGFMATILLATGGFMLMPFGSDFAVKNLKIDPNSLTFLYMITGVFTFASSFLAGMLSDKVGKMVMFTFGTVLSISIVIIYTNLGVTPILYVILLNIILFIGINSRIVPAQALLTSVPSAQDRGAFMSLNSAIQYLSGGISASIAGMIVYKDASGYIHNYPIIGYVVTGTSLTALILMFRLNSLLKREPAKELPQQKISDPELLDQ
jgi:multidrug resistance protein